MFGSLSTLATDYKLLGKSMDELLPLSAQLCILIVRGEINFFPFFLFFSFDGRKIIIFIIYQQLSLHGILRVTTLVHFYSTSSSSSSSTTTRFGGREGRLLGATEPFALTALGVVGGFSKSASSLSVNLSL